MNTANSELARELFVLSDWGNPDGNDMVSGYLYTEKGEPIPQYDLGYLLRKLQDCEGLTLYRCDHQDNSWNWEVQVDADPISEQSHFAYTDTPEDATAKLAIELIKQGILKPSKSGELK